ncbi:rod shape-determining protein MreC [Streptococcus equi]|uniref:rod shape-determining protein MreC n=1 Tax=Streptococcus equi TaxID=1336 RepID=UPI001BEDC847|nr:rod shape-determining protein MreC [Streptococcus equi]QUQ79063.1 Cell shape-determining protein MreC [Streptococcus equi subsp. zooepidemicus]WKF66498.1 rod shape-determining protein MreC [Streptococcus equi subsp. zooepidemicus]
MIIVFLFLEVILLKKLNLSRLFFWLTSLALLALTLVLLFRVAISPYLSMIIRNPVTKIDAIMSKPFAVIKEGAKELDSLMSAFSENKHLKKELRSYKLDQLQVDKLKSENRELKELLGLNYSPNNQFAARMISRNPYSWNKSLVIDSGKREIKEKSLVTSELGLIGRVTAVSQSSAHVELLTSGKNIDLPIKIVDKDKVIYGNLKAFKSESKTIVASEFNSNDSISLDAKVYTSGLDGETVADIPVGKVTGFKNAADKLKRRIFIKLYADTDNLDYVLVVGKE